MIEGKKHRFGGLFFIAGICLVVLLAALCLRGDETERSNSALFVDSAFLSENLARLKGVKATADSVEDSRFGASNAVDGDRGDNVSRWSSANVQGQPEHWLCLEFPQEQTFAFMRIYWERLNVEAFVLEVSSDGEAWREAAAFDESPVESVQSVVLDEPVCGRFLRLRTTEVSESEENQYLYYQNVSVLEWEVYDAVPVPYDLEPPAVMSREDGSRYLPLPRVPEGYEIAFAGSSQNEIIGLDGSVYDTLEEKEVQVGYRITRGEDSEESPGYTVRVPASGVYGGRECDGTDENYDGTDEKYGEDGGGYDDTAGESGDGSGAAASRPTVVPELAEWMGEKGTFRLLDGSRVIVDSEGTERKALLEMAEQFARELAEAGGPELVVSEGKETEASKGDIVFKRLSREDAGAGEKGLGEEGYFCRIGERLRLSGYTYTGLYWGSRTLLQLFTENEAVSCGLIRDYPAYRVRGFGIDIGRRMVSRELIGRILYDMSYYKMNELELHLNDNEILSTSGLNQSIEQAFTAYSGFRLESSVSNEEGEGITSADGFFTKDAFRELTAEAMKRGIRIVPEIDTPAHSLSITRVFPEIALADEPENVDHLDLSKPRTRELIGRIFDEYLEGEDPVFPAGGVVHVGMDEYFADAEDYRSYADWLLGKIQDSGRTARMWGSLSEITGKTAVRSKGVQMQIWNMQWADPAAMYAAGYDIINSLNSDLYIIPGGGYDYLDTDRLAGWEPRLFAADGRAEELPLYSGRMLGGIYFIWNDTIGNLDTGVGEEGIYDRFRQPLELLAGKLW